MSTEQKQKRPISEAVQEAPHTQFNLIGAPQEMPAGQPEAFGACCPLQIGMHNDLMPATERDRQSENLADEEVETGPEAFFTHPYDIATDSKLTSIAECLRSVVTRLENNPPPNERQDLLAILLDAAERLDSMCLSSD